MAEMDVEEDRLYAIHKKRTAEEILHRIEEMNVSGDDSLVELTSKILQCIQETDPGSFLKSVLSRKLLETTRELYLEEVCGMGIEIFRAPDPDWEFKVAPLDLYSSEKKENRHSHPPNQAVIKIADNGVLKVDKRKTKRLNTFLKFYGNRLFQSHSTDENRVAKWAALYGMQWAQLSVLGNPLDKLSQSTGIDTMELSMGKACSITVWTSIFFLNFIFAAMLTWSLPLRIPAYSMLGFSLLYYILALIVAMSGYSVSWGGSAKMSGLLFVFGGTTSLILLLCIIIIVLLYATWCSSHNEVGGEVEN